MGRIREFDSLRGLAAVAVLIHHCEVTGFYYSGLAVNLFFVLSGYLITRIIIEKMGENRFLINFYARRSLRIWPIYYLTLFALIAYNFAAIRPRLSIRGAPYFLTYLQYLPYYWDKPQPAFLEPGLVGHTWTLAIEEQFYLIWPALILLVGRRGVPAICAAVISIALLARGSGFKPQLLATQCDSLALGSWLGWLLVDGEWVERRKRVLTRVLAAVTIAATALTAAVYTGLIDWRVTTMEWDYWHPGALFILNLTFTGLVGLVALYAGHPRLTILRQRHLCYLGQISYGFYLYHVLILTYVYRTIWNLVGHDATSWRYSFLRLVVTSILTLLTAMASWEWVEKPLLRLKDRFGYDRRNHEDSIPPSNPHRDPSDTRQDSE